MDGIEAATGKVAALLAAQLPGRLAVLRQRLEVEQQVLPNPMLVSAFETGPLGLEEWPAVIVTARDTESMNRVVTTNDTQVFRCVYRLRVLVWVRAEDAGSVDRLRARMVLGVRETLLGGRELGGAAAVLPAGMRENYSDLFTDDRYGDVIAGAWVEVRVAADEALTETPIATIAEPIEVTGLNVAASAEVGPLVHPAWS